MKLPKPLKNAHTSDSKIGMGDYYGRGIKNKMGRVREDTMGMNSISPTKMKKPPKSLA